MGSSTVGPKDLMTTAQRAVAEQQRMQDARKQSALTPDLVEDMTNRFFLQRVSPDAGAPLIGLQPALPQIEAAPVAIEEPGRDIAEALEADTVEQEYVPIGSHIDVNA